MKNFLRSLLAARRRLWLGWLWLLAWPWRWLANVLGLQRGTLEPQARRAEPTPPETHETAVEPGVSAATQAAERPPAEASPEAAESPVPVAAPRVAPPTRAAEPPLPAEPGQFTEAVFRNDAGQRGYKLYIPAGAADNGPLPLVVMLHGCKQDPNDFAIGTGMNRLADQQPMLVLYPAQSKSANGFGCWNWFNRHDQQADAGEPSIIVGMVREVMAQQAVDPQRVYVAGLSAGAAMTTILVHTHPTLFAAAGIHSGLAYAAAQDMITALGVMKRGPAKRLEEPSTHPHGPGDDTPHTRPHVPLIVFHGDDDSTVHPLNGERVIEQALAEWPASGPGEGAGIVVEQGQADGGRAYTRTLHSNGTARPHLEHWLVHGAGHAWSGGHADGSFTDPLRPDASREMLRFFLERTKA